MPQRLLLVLFVLLPLFVVPASAQDSDGDEAQSVDDVPFGPAIGEERIHSWALTPAGEAGNGNSRPNMSYTAVPGTVIEDAVTIFNLGNESLNFDVYSTDAFTGADGQLGLLPSGEAPVDVGTWVELVQGIVTLTPGQQATIPLTINVPLDAAPGDHVGAVLASNSALTTAEDGAVVVLDRRTGTRLYVRVDGALQGEVAVEDLSVDFSGGINPASGDAEVSYVLANRGNIRLSGEAVLKVSGPFGVSETVLDPVVFEDFLPGDVIDITETVSGVPAAFLVSATVEVTTDESEAVQVTADDRSATTLALPLTLILLGFIGLFGWLGYRAFRRHEQSPAVVGGFVERERERETVG